MLTKPVKASLVPKTSGGFGAKAAKAIAPAGSRQRLAVKKSLVRSKRFQLKPVKHSVALTRA